MRSRTNELADLLSQIDNRLSNEENISIILHDAANPTDIQQIQYFLNFKQLAALFDDKNPSSVTPYVNKPVDFIQKLVDAEKCASIDAELSPIKVVCLALEQATTQIRGNKDSVSLLCHENQNLLTQYAKELTKHEDLKKMINALFCGSGLKTALDKLSASQYRGDGLTRSTISLAFESESLDEFFQHYQTAKNEIKLKADEQNNLGFFKRSNIYSDILDILNEHEKNMLPNTQNNTGLTT